MKNKRNKPKKKTEGKTDFKEIAVMSLRGIFIFAVLFALSSVICYVTGIDYDKYFIFLLLSSVISSFISGLVYTKHRKKNGILNGLIASLPVTAVLFALSMVINGGKVSLLAPVMFASCLLSGALSGTIGVNIGR